QARPLTLATLVRKSRQGRKAATVSNDAGAEVSRRGHRHFRHLFLRSASFGGRSEQRIAARPFRPFARNESETRKATHQVTFGPLPAGSARARLAPPSLPGARMFRTLALTLAIGAA